MRKQALLFIFLLLVTGVSIARDKQNVSKAAVTTTAAVNPEYVRTIEGIKEYKLDNGLRILLIPDSTQSNVVVNIVYNVGSRHEGYGEKGMAHLLEHMLFKSTKNLGDIKKMLSDKGGFANGTTWLDRTNYFEVFPANDENLLWSLEMEADRMINATMLQSDLDKEFSVVRNEFEIGENDPAGILYERIISAAYLWHNYGSSTIGSKEDIERVKADRLKVFYQKFYQPDNATLLIGGKFNEQKALDGIGRYFGAIPRPERVLDKTYTVEPEQDGERYVELRRAGDLQIIGAAYHTSAFADKDAAPLDALIEILTAKPSGYMYKALVDPQIVTSLSGYQMSLRDPGYAYFDVEIPKDKNIEEVKTVFLSELDKIPQTAYTEQDLKRAKSKLLKHIDDTKNNTINYTVDLTEKIASGDYRLNFLYRDAVENMTLADIQRVAERYFRQNNRTYGMFIPTGNDERVKPDEISNEFISQITENYTGKKMEDEDLSFEASIRNIKDHLATGALPNGFKYGFLKKPVKGKQVIATFTIPFGNLKALKGKSTSGSIMASMLKSGTKSMTNEQIQDKLDETRTNIAFSFGGQNLNINISTYQEYLPSTLNLLRELLTESVFPEAEFSKNVNIAISDAENSRNEPQSVVFREISRKMEKYPSDHPFYTPDTDETIARLKALKLSEVIDFYKTFPGGEHGFGTVVGDINAPEVEKMLSSTFGSWKSKTPYEKIMPTFFETKYAVEKIITPDKQNAAMVAAVPFRMDQKSADYPAMVIASEMFGQGGFMTARIPNRLREKEGISYGAGAFQDVPYDNEVSSWGIYSFFNPQNQPRVDAAVKEEIDLILKEGFTAEELQANVKSWMNGRVITLGMDRYLIMLINETLRYGRSLDDFTDLENKVKALNVEQVNKTVGKYIDPASFVYIYAGDFQ